MGINQSNYLVLKEAILEAVFSNFAIFEKENNFGELYRLDFSMTYAGKTAIVRTGWVILEGEDYARLTLLKLNLKMAAQDLELLDAIVLDKDLPALGLRRGTIGTIVEVLNADTFLVEFSAVNGESYAMEFLKKNQLLKIHQQPVPVAA